MFVPKARIHFYFCNACLQMKITSAVELSAGLAVVMSDLWQSRLNCTNAKCTVSTEFNSRCLKNLRVESGITKLKVKLNHHSICLHICLCSSESAKQLLQPLTLTRHAANLPSVCHDALRARLSLGEVTNVHLASTHSAPETFGPLLPCTHPSLWSSPPLRGHGSAGYPCIHSWYIFLKISLRWQSQTNSEMLNKHSLRNSKEV